MKTLTIFVGIMIAACAACGQHLTEMQVAIKVVNEEGQVVSNAVVGVGFDQGGNAWIGEKKGENPKGISDTAGIFRASAKCTGALGVSAKKDGYYSWMSQFYFYRLGENHDGAWQPFDPINDGITAVLRKIGKPVPMYAKRVDVRIPAFEIPIGYDLKVGDWVAPQGKGAVTDLVFQVERRITSQEEYDATLTIGISRQGDGLQEVTAFNPQGSTLRLSVQAPVVGYQDDVCVKWGRKPSAGGAYGNVGDDNTPNYVFRVRSEMDERGVNLYALYGKVHGAFRITGVLRNEARLSFTYYLNPTPNDRNLEFDPKQNLFKNLEWFEQVKEP